MPNATHVIATGRPRPYMRWLTVFAVSGPARMAAVRRVQVCSFQIARPCLTGQLSPVGRFRAASPAEDAPPARSPETLRLGRKRVNSETCLLSLTHDMTGLCNR